MRSRSSRSRKPKTIAFVLLLGVGAWGETRVEAASPSPIQVRAAEALERSGVWYIRWDETTGSPAWIEEQRLSIGAAYRRPRPFDAEALAASFIRSHADLFPLRWGRDSLTVARRFETPDPRRRGSIIVVRSAQLFMGLPVEAGEYVISMSPDGKVLGLNGRFHRGIEVDPRPTIDAEAAEGIAMREVGAGADSVVRPILLEVVRGDDRDHLVWVVTVPESPLAVWAVKVDAHDGRVVRRGNLVIVDPR